MAGFAVRHLEVRQPPVTGGGRIETAAGELAQVVNGESFRFLAYAEFARPGAQRGNHFHLRRVENLYVLSGVVEARFRDVDGGETTDVTLRAGDLARIEPRCAHAFLAREQAQAIEFAATPYDPSETTAYDLALS